MSGIIYSNLSVLVALSQTDVCKTLVDPERRVHVRIQHLINTTFYFVLVFLRI